ncbi:hypothetical protein [Solidesulfovibrio sp.]
MKSSACKISLCVLIGCLLAGVFPFGSPDWIKDIVLPLVGAFVGIVIGSVGIFLGGLGALFNGIASMDRRMSREEVEDAYNELRLTVNEIKDNLILSLAMFAMCFLFYCVVQFDLPVIEWPSFLWFSKTAFCNGVVFSCVAICFWAMFDSIAAVFEVNKFHEIISRLE